MRILIGFVEIGGYHGALEVGFRKLGHTCNFFEFRPHPFGYANRSRPLISKIVIWLLALRKRFDSKLIGLPITIIRLALQFAFFNYAALRYNVFIFGFGSTFFTPITPSLERFRFFGARFLVRMGKKVIFLMQGSDARPPFMDGTFQHESMENIVTLNQLKKNQILKIEQTGATIICDRALSAYFTKPVVDRSYILCPVDTGRIHAPSQQAAGHRKRGIEVIRILHAPSAPELKGSDLIAKAVQRLRIPGKKIEYTEIRNKKNSEVIEAIRACDIVIDQLYSDIVLPVFPSEAAWLGKPVVIGVYDPNFVFRNLPPAAIPPAWYVHPNKLFVNLKKILSMPRQRIAQRGQDMHRFMMANATEVRVAEKFVRIINRDIPKSWYYNPMEYDYPYGCVIREEIQRRLISGIVGKFSIDALFMSDKIKYVSRLKKEKFINYASQNRKQS